MITDKTNPSIESMINRLLYVGWDEELFNKATERLNKWDISYQIKDLYFARLENVYAKYHRKGEGDNEEMS